MASSSFPFFRVETHAAAVHHRHSASIPRRHLRARPLTLLPGMLCLAGLGACTWLSFSAGQSFAFTGFLYLVLVVLAAMYGGFWQATLISVAAVACLDYFFIPPIFSFANSPANWVALGAFEFTALMISRLSLRAQSQAMEAIAGRRDMERLYETSRRILLLESSSEQGTLIAALIRETFGLEAVQLLDGLSGTTYQSGEGPPLDEERIRNAFASGVDTFDPETRSWYCVLRQGGRPVGGLALSDTSMNQLAATALASLCGIALERARALQRESRAEAARQAEQLRTAVLDALAHQFKTPLTVAQGGEFRSARRGRLVRVADGPGDRARQAGERAGASGVATPRRRDVGQRAIRAATGTAAPVEARRHRHPEDRTGDRIGTASMCRLPGRRRPYLRIAN